MNANRISSNRTVARMAIALATAFTLSAAPMAYWPIREITTCSKISFPTSRAWRPTRISNLLNAWGIVFNPFGFVWVSDNGSGLSTLYDGTGTPQGLVVVIPPAARSGFGQPDRDRVQRQCERVQDSHSRLTPIPAATAAAAFIWVTEDGVLAAWNTIGADPGASPAKLVLDNSTLPSPPVYKGLALSANGDGARLYATDFHNNKIDVWDGNFTPVTPPDGFTDPKLPPGFAPFGIQAINGNHLRDLRHAGRRRARRRGGQGSGLCRRL